MPARRKHLARNNEVLTGLSQLTPTAARALGFARPADQPIERAARTAESDPGSRH